MATGEESCVWTEDCGWVAACDPTGGFQFNDGGPDDNGFRFCPYCGKPLKEEGYSDDE